MTTKVRIENAGADLPLMVQVQEVNAEGKWVSVGEPRVLRHTADLMEEYLHQNKRVIVFEIQLGNA